MASSRLSSRTRCAVAPVLAAACAFALSAATAGAATIDSGTAVHADVSPPLRSLAPSRSSGSGAHPARAFGKTSEELRLEPHDRGRQALDAPAAAPVAGSQWDGVNNVNGVIPPDTNGDVGPRDYVQWVNLSLRIWSKSGVSRYGPVPGNTLFQGFGGLCETTNQGDPVVTYDRAADRWVLMQFAFATKGGGTPAAPFRVCVAVSQTGDPTGAYNRYEFTVTSNFPDYPKLGVWNDAYYLTTNNFSGSTFVGAGIYALDRTKMLAGDRTAGFVGQQLPATYGGLLPAHRDGPTPPPAGAPGYFAGIDTEGAGTGSTVQVWRMHPNFATPAATTVSGPSNLAVNPYRFSFGCSANPDCIPQGGTSRTLDALSDRLMHRVEYRNFGDHESLLLTHTVNVASGSASQAGERWYELRNVGGAPAVYQQGTYAPADGVSRWMGSAAMDGYGDIALGYSASSSSMSPAIRYTGRLGGDPLGSMTLGEQSLQAGGGSQTGYPRWGDYSSMSIDPVDDATFWYTQEYYSSTSSASWRTRIGSFKLATTPTVALTAPADGAVATGTPLFSGTAAGGTGDVSVAVYSGGSTSGTLIQTRSATPSGGAWSVSAGPALGEGTYTAQARQSDASGRVGYSRVSTFRIDATPPAVSISSPASGTSTSDSTPTLSGTGGTAPGDLSAIAIDLHSGGAAGPIVRTLNTTRAAGGAWSATPSTALAEGAYTAIARQSDTAGNSGSSTPVSFSVDTTPPVVSLTGPGAFTSDTMPAFNGSATAGDLAAVTVKIYSGTSASGTVLQTLGAIQSSGAWGPVSSTALAQGAYTARAEQSDGAGNTGFSSPVTFTVDTAAPAVSVTSPAAGSATNDSTPAISGDAGNAAGDGATVTVNVYGPNGTADPPLQTIPAARSAGTWSATAAPLPDGAYKVQAAQADAAGNTSTSALVSFTIDATPPALTLTTPAPGDTTGYTPTFQGAVGTAPGDQQAVAVSLWNGTNTSLAPMQAQAASVSSGLWSATPPPLMDGTYTVRAEQSDGLDNTQTRQVTFTVAATQPPVASFGFAPASPLAGALATFDGSASADPDGSIASWAWSFGDGATGTGVTTSHVYDAAGDYSAQLTVTDNSGGSASTTRLVPVGPAPITPAGESQPTPGTQSVSPGVVVPQLSVRLTRQRLVALLRRGLSFRVKSNVSGVVRARILISGPTARRLGLRRRTTIATGRHEILADTSLPMTLRPGRAVRTHLGTALGLHATLTVALGTTKVDQPVSLRR